MAEEPMPASQAKTMALISGIEPAEAPAAPAAPPAANIPPTEDFLPFMASMSAAALARSPSSLLDMRRMAQEIAAETTVAARKPRITPSIWAGGALLMRKMIEPGTAGERRPASKSSSTSTPDMPPRMVAMSSCGFMSTYGK